MNSLPPGFRSEFVTTDRLRHHVVTGGSGPPLLLINGWPQTWYAWRHVLPPLAGHFTVVAAEPRGIGKSDKTRDGYDTGSLAEDLVDLMTALGHEEFAVLGHDVGMWIGYALAADHPERVTRLAVAEAAVPGISPEAPFFGSAAANNRLFHFGFNRLDGINEELVRGREALYFGHQFASKTAAANELEPHAVEEYVSSIAADADSLRASFEPYRALETTIEQNLSRRQQRLTLPVLAIGGAESTGELVGQTMESVADDVESHVLDGSGHYPAEERPEEFLALVLPFLTKQR
ncbi:alpha/beta fold hydrolase [Amycolatopsis jejuensis]|uniref:alpha/beta fold hydrolase n=1 Tax=Amycolatopsis jejuensis TaxID=330084 RepID=UPI001FE05BEA|nr:alpha/beta hydrolase [Amycolatopsis jejuensis]